MSPKDVRIHRNGQIDELGSIDLIQRFLTIFQVDPAFKRLMMSDFAFPIPLVFFSGLGQVPNP